MPGKSHSSCRKEWMRHAVSESPAKFVFFWPKFTIELAFLGFRRLNLSFLILVV